MTRAFIAIHIKLNPHFQEIINQLKSHLKHEKIRWVEKENIHLTLRFLGDLDEEQISNVKRALETISLDTSKFAFELKGVSYFGRKQNPSVIYFGIGESERLREFVSLLTERLEEIGFEMDNKTYSPHLTLGRIKFIKDKSSFFRVIEDVTGDERQLILANEIILYESILKPSGPKYEPIQKFLLN